MAGSLHSQGEIQVSMIWLPRGYWAEIILAFRYFCVGTIFLNAIFFSAHLKRGGEQDRQRIRDFATPTTMYCGVVLPSRNIFLKDYEYWHSMSLLNWWDTDVRSRRSFSCIMKGEKNKAEHGPGPLLRVLQIGLANVILKLLFFLLVCHRILIRKGWRV